MGKHQDFLEEGRAEQDQPLIRLLRNAYQPGKQDARSISRIRQRLLSGGYQQVDAQQKTHSDPDSQMHFQRIGSMNSQGSPPRNSRLRHWCRDLTTVAAVFAIVLVIGSLVIALNLIHRSLPAALPITTPTSVSSHTPTGVKNIHMISNITGWIFCTDGSVLRTTDGGLNRVDVTPSFLLTSRHEQHLGVGSLFPDNSTAWIVVLTVDSGTSFTFHTNDAGRTWQEGTIQTHVVLATVAPTYDITATSAHEAWIMSVNDGLPTSGGAAQGTTLRIRIPPLKLPVGSPMIEASRSSAHAMAATPGSVRPL